MHKRSRRFWCSFLCVYLFCEAESPLPGKTGRMELELSRLCLTRYSSPAPLLCHRSSIHIEHVGGRCDEIIGNCLLVQPGNHVAC
ncbi:hypothetical protein CTAM01_04555 [Colletotrichum tamarilloi]|uniref:Secreted protein n=1 Tax=Colletotrichum tamarilloi TaxID=1209934 RepID=A0ABQ9RH18_9PEZI|nr:uncharacterized protein CTAM01_04555 [Colletotrichum tamarilloi]KAI3551662.1 hypothetical protein CSPX01_01004 [Colletotrichum filicis]KAK1503243.1 hypothetical protein CTAM01_04555 [Colletotrichum tamarilloi]